MGLQVLVQGQVQEGGHNALALLLGHLLDALTLELPVPPLLSHEDLDQVPAPVEESPRITPAIRPRRLLGNGALHRLCAQRPAGLSVPEGPDPFLIRLGHGRVPGGHAREHDMRADQVFVLGNIQPQPQVADRPSSDGYAGAIGPDTRLEGLF